MTDNIRAIAADAAERYGLPLDIVLAVIDAESSELQYSNRYEPAFFRRYIQNNPDIKAVAPCDLETEKINRATSWGLMQVMGQVARERGFRGPYLPALCDPITGIEYGCKHLAAFAAKFKERYGWAAVCAAYNGGAGAVRGENNFTNPAYPAKILKRLPGNKWPA